VKTFLLWVALSAALPTQCEIEETYCLLQCDDQIAECLSILSPGVCFNLNMFCRERCLDAYQGCRFGDPV
jgi:hypothetical protein